MADNLVFPFSGQVILDANGDPVSGAKLEVFDAGTTNQKTVYTDAGLTSAAANPVVADSNGIIPLRYLGTGSWKVTFKDSSDTTLSNYDTWDNVPGALDTSSFLTGSVSPSRASIAKTSNYTTVSGDIGKQINCDATGGDFSITLLSASAAGDAADFVVKNTGQSGKVTVTAGSSSIPINPLDSATFRSDGASWHVTEAYEATGNITTLTYGASVSPDLKEATGNAFQVTLTGDMTLSNPTNIRAGTFFTVTFIQDATGGREVTFDNYYKTDPPINIAASAVTVVGFHVRESDKIDCWLQEGTRYGWDYVAVNQQSQGTDGGTATSSGSWETSTLNNQLIDRFGFGAPSSNEVTIPPGVWEFEWAHPFVLTAKSQSRLYNVTSASVISYGSSTTSPDDTSLSVGYTRVTFSAATTVRIEYQVQTTNATDGQGVNANFGTEIYLMFKCRKVAS